MKVDRKKVRVSQTTKHTDEVAQLKKANAFSFVLLDPAMVVCSKADSQVNLFYRYYPSTPVTQKYLCIVEKVRADDAFIITAYFTDTIKRGKVLWERK